MDIELKFGGLVARVFDNPYSMWMDTKSLFKFLPLTPGDTCLSISKTSHEQLDGFNETFKT